MLPDLIDKPLGIYLLRRQLSSGRIYGHALLLVSVLCWAARYWPTADVTGFRALGWESGRTFSLTW